MTTICIDCRYIAARPSGIAEVVRSLVDIVPNLAPDLDFLLLRNPSVCTPLSQARNVQEIIVPQAANGPATMWWLSHIVNLSGVDLFHAPSNIMPAGLKMPCITTVHDIMWLTNPRWCNPRPYGRIEQLFYAHGIRRALRRSAAIATVSEASRREIMAQCPDAADRIFVALSGVAADFRPVDIDPCLLESLGLARGRRFVLVVGQYAPYKNHDGAMRAFASAFQDIGDIDLVFVQRMGAASRRLAQLADRLGLTGRVHILASIERGALIQLYSAATALLHPSLCEGFGNPVAEAMACGCPVITSNVSAMPEVAGGAAILVPPLDKAAIAAALRQVAAEPATAREMRAKGIARATELSWETFAQQNLNLYRRVLGNI